MTRVANFFYAIIRKIFLYFGEKLASPFYLYFSKITL
jgi:hypothetical protein